MAEYHNHRRCGLCRWASSLAPWESSSGPQAPSRTDQRLEVNHEKEVRREARLRQEAAVPGPDLLGSEVADLLDREVADFFPEPSPGQPTSIRLKDGLTVDTQGRPRGTPEETA